MYIYSYLYDYTYLLESYTQIYIIHMYISNLKEIVFILTNVKICRGSKGY